MDDSALPRLRVATGCLALRSACDCSSSAHTSSYRLAQRASGRLTELARRVGQSRPGRLTVLALAVEEPHLRDCDTRSVLGIGTRASSRTTISLAPASMLDGAADVEFAVLCTTVGAWVTRSQRSLTPRGRRDLGPMALTRASSVACTHAAVPAHRAGEDAGGEVWPRPCRVLLVCLSMPPAAAPAVPPARAPARAAQSMCREPPDAVAPLAASRRFRACPDVVVDQHSGTLVDAQSTVTSPLQHERREYRHALRPVIL